MSKKMETLETSKTTIKGAKGNTKKRPNQLMSWFFTLNNYTLKDIESMKLKFDEICERYVFEEEIGTKNEVPHLQGVIFLKSPMRWSEFNLTDRIKWLKTKDKEASIKYCQKDFHYEGRNIYYKGITLVRPLEIPYYTSLDIYIESLIKENTYNKRSINWFWSEKGSFGKSTLFKYFLEKYKNVNLIQMLKVSAKDLLNACFTYRGDEPIFILNIPRSCKLTTESYTAIESIKDGILCNYKSYKNEVKSIRRPLIIIFANYAPKIDNKYLSQDRYKIFQMDYLSEVKNFQWGSI